MAAARAHFNLTTTTPSAAEGQSWRHSPVPYLFGGLAAMLGLIAFALLILAFSYWRLSGYFDGGSGEGDLEAGEAKEGEEGKAKEAVFEEKVVVIMAGETGPRFLATPMWSGRSSSFRDSSSGGFGYGDEKSGKLEMVSEEVKQGRSLEPENSNCNHGDIAG